MSGEKASHRFGRRRLTEDEEQLWSVVARSVKPLRPHHGVVSTAKPKLDAADAARPPRNSKTQSDSTTLRPRPGKPTVPPPTMIARREKQQLARGKAAIEGRIDLHGMTQAEAHGALLRFVQRSQATGAKYVLVITGKGGAGASRGVLRRQVPLWLGLPEFRACVLGFDVAHIGHGGEGALYLRLRKRRQ